MSTTARLIVIIALVGFAWIVNTGWAVSTPVQRTAGIVLGGVALLLAAGLAFPQRGRAARRVVAGLIALVYLVYFVTELAKLIAGEPQPLGAGRTSALMAGVGLLFWGIPMLVYALGGPSLIAMINPRWHAPEDSNAGS